MTVEDLICRLQDLPMDREVQFLITDATGAIITMSLDSVNLGTTLALLKRLTK